MRIRTPRRWGRMICRRRPLRVASAADRFVTTVSRVSPTSAVWRICTRRPPRCRSVIQRPSRHRRPTRRHGPSRSPIGPSTGRRPSRFPSSPCPSSPWPSVLCSRIRLPVSRSLSDLVRSSPNRVNPTRRWDVTRSAPSRSEETCGSAPRPAPDQRTTGPAPATISRIRLRCSPTPSRPRWRRTGASGCPARSGGGERWRRP